MNKTFHKLETHNNIVGYRDIYNPDSAQISEALQLDKSWSCGSIIVYIEARDFAWLRFDNNNFLLEVHNKTAADVLIDTRRKDVVGDLVSMVEGESPPHIVIDDFNVAKKMMLNYLNTNKLVDDPPFIWVPIREVVDLF